MKMKNWKKEKNYWLGKKENYGIPLWQRSTSLYWRVLAAGWAVASIVERSDDGKYRHGAESEYRYSIPTQLWSYAHSSRQPARRVVVSAETWTDPDDVTSSTFVHDGVQPIHKNLKSKSQHTQWLGRQSCDRKIASSTPGRWIVG